MHILTIITTYNRPKLFERLIDALIVEMDLDNFTHSVLIADDGSEPQYAETLADKLQENGIDTHLLRSDENGGKENYWYLMHQVYRRTKNMAWDILVQLPDDILPAPGMYQTIEAFLSKLQAEKVLINLYRCHRESEWGSGEPFDIDKHIRHTGWMDMCYACKREAIAAISYAVHPVWRNWHIEREMGSGVGAQLSRRLRNAGVNQYQFKKSVVIDTGEHPSQMNPLRTFQFKSQ